MISLIGHTGFVGSYLKNTYGDQIVHKYHSKDVRTSVNIPHDVVICAAPSARKWWANLHPEADLANINELVDILRLMKCVKFILLSTIDVYPNLNGSDETTTIPDDKEDNHAYGRNRAYLEKNCSRIFGDRLYIIRLSGLFGYGLRKNIIYDFIHGELKQLNISSQFQWYGLQFLRHDIDFILDHQIKSLNLFAEPLTNQELLSIFESFRSCADIELTSSNPIKYDCYTIHRKSSEYWLTKDTIVSALRDYMSQMINSKLVISTLCYEQFDEQDDTAKKYGLNKIEVAPFQYFGPHFIDKPLEFFDSFRNKNIYSFQALFYPETFTIYHNYDDVLNYLKKLIDIAEYLDVKVLVFGSPKVRACPPDVAYDKFFKKCISLFQTLGDYLSSKKITICIEPNARVYECNFLTTSVEVRSFILNVDRPKIRLVLDTGCMTLEEEIIEPTLESNIDILHHVHFSVPHLRSLKTQNHSIKFQNVLRCLKKLKYDKLINIEMLNQSVDEIDRCLYELTRSPSIAIVGGGWYGCHIARKLLQKGIYTSIFEKRHIFAGASKFNQNRLHLGFHYPRSFATRRLCRDNHDRFIIEYGSSVRPIDRNMYIIANKSLLDFETYCQIMKASDLSFTVAEAESNDFHMNHIQGFLCCDEKFLDPIVMRHYFEALLERFVINTTINKEDIWTTLSERYDIVLDCSNNQLGLIEVYKQRRMIFETTLSIVYKRLYEGPVISFTVMDGPLPSLFPFDLHQNLYSLTHAEYTPLQKTTNVEELHSYVPDAETILNHRAAMENEIRLYVKDFDQKFKYNGYFTSIKVKPGLPSDSRECIIQVQKNVISVSCGKITGIFDFEDALKRLNML
jgi:sugar phosphate isomerase/epimerase